MGLGDRMSKRAVPVLLTAMVLLAGCSTASGTGEDPAPAATAAVAEANATPSTAKVPDLRGDSLTTALVRARQFTVRVFDADTAEELGLDNLNYNNWEVYSQTPDVQFDAAAGSEIFLYVVRAPGV